MPPQKRRKNTHGYKKDFKSKKIELFVWYFLFLYKSVGSEYDWTDQLLKTNDEINDFINNQKVRFFTLIKDGWTAGFFILDYRNRNLCDLSYIGLVPDAIGIGQLNKGGLFISK